MRAEGLREREGGREGGRLMTHQQSWILTSGLQTSHVRWNSECHAGKSDDRQTDTQDLVDCSTNAHRNVHFTCTYKPSSFLLENGAKYILTIPTENNYKCLYFVTTWEAIHLKGHAVFPSKNILNRANLHISQESFICRLVSTYVHP